MGNIALNTNSYFNFIPASYGILNAINGTTSDLLAIDLDNMVLGAYNAFSYYNNLLNIQNTSANLFANMNNIQNPFANGINTTNPFAPNGNVSFNGKTGTSEEKEEYDDKIKFLNRFLEFKNMKEVKKALEEIKSGKMSYKEANEKIDEIIADLYNNHKDYIEKYANKIAKDKFKSRKDVRVKEMAQKLGDMLEKVDKNATSSDIELMRQITDDEDLGKDNILQFVSEYNKSSSGTIIKDIQAKADGIKNYDGKSLWWNGDKEKQLANDIDKVIRNISNALLEKAEQYEDDLSDDAKAKVKALKDTLKTSECLYKDASLATKFNDVYGALRFIEANEDNEAAKDEIDKYLPDEAKINVTGAKDKVKEDLEEEGFKVK